MRHTIATFLGFIVALSGISSEPAWLAEIVSDHHEHPGITDIHVGPDHAHGDADDHHESPDSSCHHHAVHCCCEHAHTLMSPTGGDVRQPAACLILQIRPVVRDDNVFTREILHVPIA